MLHSGNVFLFVTNSTVETDEWETRNEELIDSTTTLIVLRILMLGVTPTLSVFGIVGNCFSIAVLVKQGLHKCSNILLVALATSDITYLIAFNSIPKILYEVIGLRGFDDFTENQCRILFVLFVFFTYFDYVFWSTSFTLPMLITLERLVVIFCPFSFHRIVTPRRTWSAASVVFLFWLTVFTYPSLWYQLHYVYFNDSSVSIGFLERSDLYQKDSTGVEVIERLNVYVTILVSPVFTVVGCVIILIKVKDVSRKRKKITSKDISTNRTTRMLLAVCAVYVVAAAISNFPLYFPEYFSVSLTDASPSNVARIMYQVMNIFASVNSSCNFVVYVGLNKTFRDTYKDLFACCRRQNLSSHNDTKEKHIIKNILDRQSTGLQFAMGNR